MAVRLQAENAVFPGVTEAAFVGVPLEVGDIVVPLVANLVASLAVGPTARSDDAVRPLDRNVLVNHLLIVNLRTHIYKQRSTYASHVSTAISGA